MQAVSKFLVRLGFPLRIVRQSWGAHSDLGVLLIAWADNLDETGRFVRVLGPQALSESNPSFGLRERIDHLRALWSGGLAGYAVVATAKDTAARPRKIQSYPAESVRIITSLIVQPRGVIWAELGDDLPAKRLKKHAASHRLVPGEGAFPIERVTSKAFKASSAAYIAKLPAIRRWLIDVARHRETVTYAQARAPFNLRTLEHRHAMDRIGHECLGAGEPILTSLIVDETTNQCSEGFFKEFRRNDAEEREDCYAFWQTRGELSDQPAGGGRKITGTVPSNDVALDEALRTRAAHFAKTAVRPEQAAFRRRVFLECHGACIVTNCSIPEALDAAHREGRDWQLGHNSGTDGFLLRKDIHALYDAKLVSIDDSGTVTFHSDVEPHYRGYLRKS